MVDQSFLELVKIFNQQYDKFSKRVDKLEAKVDQRNDDVFQKVDAVYKELLDLRSEQAVHQQQHDDISEELDRLKSINSP